MKPVIVCMAKLEKDYIEEWVKYHLALGFQHIYIYDNEDISIYKELFKECKNITVFDHIKGNQFIHPETQKECGNQYIVLHHFAKNVMFKNEITHVAHIDIDEFIVLKKHKNITEFINEYIKDDCQAIAMNWRFFGSNGNIKKTDEPVTIRFTTCEGKADTRLKTLFKIDNFQEFKDTHNVSFKIGYTKTTDGIITQNEQIHNHIKQDVIQLNHYKSKTWEEFKYISQRGKASMSLKKQNSFKKKIDVKQNFLRYDKNKIEDLTAYNFYKNNVLKIFT